MQPPFYISLFIGLIINYWGTMSFICKLKHLTDCIATFSCSTETFLVNIASIKLFHTISDNSFGMASYLL